MDYDSGIKGLNGVYFILFQFISSLVCLVGFHLTGIY